MARGAAAGTVCKASFTQLSVNFHQVEQEVVPHVNHVVIEHRQFAVPRCQRAAFTPGEAWRKDVMNTGPPKILRKPVLTCYLARLAAGQRRSPRQGYDSRTMLLHVTYFTLAWRVVSSFTTRAADKDT